MRLGLALGLAGFGWGRSGDDLLKKSRQGFLKRQKELSRMEKKRAKADKLAARKRGELVDEPAQDDEFGEFGMVEGLDFHEADGASPDALEAARAASAALADGEQDAAPANVAAGSSAPGLDPERDQDS